MKVGDLVALEVHWRGRSGILHPTGVIVDVIQKKCWRASNRGRKVDWSAVDPEPHGKVLVDNDILTIPFTDLRVIE